MVYLLSVFSLPFYGVTPSRGAERKRATVACRQQRDLAGPRRTAPARSAQGDCGAIVRAKQSEQSGGGASVVIGDLVSCHRNLVICNLNCAARTLRAAAFSFALAASALAVTAAVPASDSSRLSAVSLTSPETTIPYVASRPTRSAPISVQLAQNEMNSAQSSDIAISAPRRFLFAGVVAVVWLGVSIVAWMVKIRPSTPGLSPSQSRFLPTLAALV